jgi:hypothetical protein
MEHDIHHKELWPLSHEQLEQRFGVPVSRAANLPVVVHTEAKLEFPLDFGRPGVCKLLICPVCARAGTTHEKKPCLQISWNIDWHKNPHNSKNPGHNARVVASLVTLEEAWQSGALQHTAAAVLKFLSRPTRAQANIPRTTPAFSAAPTQTVQTCVVEGLFGEEVTSAPAPAKTSKQHADLMREKAAKRMREYPEEPALGAVAADAQSMESGGSSCDDDDEGEPVQQVQLAPPRYGKEALATAEVRVNYSSDFIFRSLCDAICHSRLHCHHLLHSLRKPHDPLPLQQMQSLRYLLPLQDLPPCHNLRPCHNMLHRFRNPHNPVPVLALLLPRSSDDKRLPRWALYLVVLQPRCLPDTCPLCNLQKRVQGLHPGG